ncbi:MAG TPA: AMP-binding protein, partial [Clostridiales bacterium]|nr:AMP-binding protein [Clostridiales bacterium]
EDVSNKTAMLQFSSGSTGTPKGVMLTHKNLISNVDAIINTMQVKKEDIIFNWLPLSHDFGLIVMHMTVLFQGCEQIIMTPSKFLRNPSIWSNIITKYGVSIVAIPNFAMKLILKTYNKQEYENSDLHTLRIVVTAGEGISINTCSKFEQVFCTNKLAKNVIVSAYGLAEATAAVTCGVLEEDATFIVSNNVLIGEKIERNRIQSANDKRIVSCGKIIDCNKVYIYDDEGNQLGDNYVGNIIVEGDNVTKGYYRNPSATKEAIKEGQLNTGDIGFISNGELYISGRKKEMIIINGKNFFSGDVETVINLNLASSKGILIAAFKVTKNDSEELYVAIEGEENFSEQLVREIKKCVLDKMQLKVSNVVVVESIPRTASGKPQYYLLTQMFEKTDVLEVLIEMIEMFTEEKITEDDLGRPFTELGIDSIKMEYMFSELEKKFKVPITIDVIWNYPTLEKLAEYLDKHKTKVSNNRKVNKRISKEKISYNDQDIAVISMACHFPGNADTPKEYWDNLLQKKDDICDIDEDRLKNLGNNKLKDYKGGYLQDVGALNAKEFGLSPREIQSMDPQQRLLLRTAEELLDNASLNKETVSGTNTGVFVGISNHDYCLLCDDDKGDVYTSTGNAFSIAANRISYLYNLTGPSMSVDTACSSSLVTVHIAAQALKNDECDMAICGGVNVILNSEISKAFYEAQMLSKDSKCKTFDEFANGYVRGEGCGLVLLKRVKDAVADKDDIYAIVKGSAINQDGRSNGLTAPNGNAQKKVITKALEKANISPNELDYIEAHGTGTKLGDPIELNSINSVFENANSNSHICYIGSVKTNIGHLESAAGIASLIKSTLMLNENKIPPILNFKSLNPYIVINEEKIQIATEENLRHRKNILQNIGMSSFGFGGTNCHMIISRYSGNANINKLTSKCKSQDSFWTSVKKRKERNEDIKMNSEVLVEMRKQTELLAVVANI